MARKPKESAPVFTKAQLIEGAAVFGVQPEVMKAALLNTETATKAEAEKLLHDFLKEAI